MSKVKLNYVPSSIKIKSIWFEKGVIRKVTPKGLNVYLSLFRFLVYNQENTYTFITCLDYIKKYLPEEYTKEVVLEHLKTLQKNKVIQVDISRWDQMLDENGKVRGDKTITIIATDIPNTTIALDDKKKEYDKPVTEDDYYISIHMPMIEYFQTQHTSKAEEFTCFYLIGLKYLYSPQGCNVAYETMEKWTGIDKNTMNRIAWKMVEFKLNYIDVEKKKGANGTKKENHHHYVCHRYDNKTVEAFTFRHGDMLEAKVKKAIKKEERAAKKLEQAKLKKLKEEYKRLNGQKKKVDLREEVEKKQPVVDEMEQLLVELSIEHNKEEVPLAFGHKGSEKKTDHVGLIPKGNKANPPEEKKDWGTPDPDAPRLLFPSEEEPFKDNEEYGYVKEHRFKTRRNEKGIKEYYWGGEWLSRIEIEITFDLM